MYTTVKSGYIGFEKHVFFCKLSETFAIKWVFFLYCCFILKQSNVRSVHVSVIQHMQVRCCILLFSIKLQSKRSTWLSWIRKLIEWFNITVILYNFCRHWISSVITNKRRSPCALLFEVIILHKQKAAVSSEFKPPPCGSYQNQTLPSAVWVSRVRLFIELFYWWWKKISFNFNLLHNT